MAAAANSEDRLNKLLESEEIFRTSALSIIIEVVKLSEKHHQETLEFVDEILYSIFFLGNINIPSYSPELIVNVPEYLELLKDAYPRPFELLSSQDGTSLPVPRRGPFSCVLDMVVQVTGEREEGNIIHKLQEIVEKADPNGIQKFVSSTICVSQRENSPLSPRYYGVSVSAQRNKILIGASCLSNWHPFVANAVMTFYPHMTPKSYFNGTFILPPEVRCHAFDLIRGAYKPPCLSCANLYGLATDAVRGFSYGNCAEAESLSNLFKNQNISGIIWPVPQASETDLRPVKRQVENDLTSFLRIPQGIPITFYTP